MRRTAVNGWLVLLSGIVFLLVWHGLIYGAGSDPRYTLIVSQSILENGTIALDAYRDDLIWGQPADFSQNFNIVERNGRFYNYFPVGPSVLAVPFVAVANAVGWNMLQAVDNIYAQRLLSSLSCVLVLWLVYGIARAYLDRKSSLVVTAVSVLGSTLISTLGVALWSLNFSVVCVAAAMLLLARYDAGRASTIDPVLLGLFLFLSYFSRAAAAAFILPVFGYLLWQCVPIDKKIIRPIRQISVNLRPILQKFARTKPCKELLITAVVSGSLLAGFLIWSRFTFGSWLPIYYSTVRLQVERGPLWLALVGHLFSPARGIFVFSPFFLLIGLGLWQLWPQVRGKAMLWLCLTWLGLHLLAASRGTVWWGGDSFGPRILTESMLALTLLTVLMWRAAQTHFGMRWRRPFLAAYLLLGLVGIWIHSYQGLFNYSIALWNSVASHQSAPPYTHPLGDLFSWRYAQALADNEMICEMDETRRRALLARIPLLRSYEWGEPIVYGEQTAVSLTNLASPPPPHSRQALLIGWAPIDNDRAPWRELQCETAHILIRLDDVPGESYALEIRTAAFGRQRVQISVNGEPVGEVTFAQQLRLASETAVIPFSADLLNANTVNEITLHLPDAARASYRDPTRLSLAIESVTIHARP